MADYIVKDTELTSVANAIRTAGGTNSLLNFPNGFVSAVNNISGGGSSDFSTATVTIINNIPDAITTLYPVFSHVNNHEITDYLSGFVINEDTGVTTFVDDGWSANYGTSEYTVYLIPSHNFSLDSVEIASEFERITVSGFAEKSYISEGGSNHNSIIVTGDCTITIS